MKQKRIEELAHECYEMRDEDGVGEHFIARILSKAVNEAIEEAADVVENLDVHQRDDVGAPYYIRNLKVSE